MVINGHNKKILSQESVEERTCNCRNGHNKNILSQESVEERNPDMCPLNGNCLKEEVMYEATVTSNLPRYEVRTYKGITKRPWKERFKEHKKSFKNKKLMNDTELSKEIWRIKDKGGTFTVNWKILRKAKAYNPRSKRCMLCLTEKLAIAEHEGRDMLNKRSEAVAKCRHQSKYALSSVDVR